ncbi:MAG: Ca2+-dependent phosphoinositide-specific phospholipase C [Candidatus Binatia bacterium]
MEQDANVRPQRLQRLRERLANRCVALNEIQVLGSHNSYHVQPRPALYAALLNLAPAFQAWEYTHPPLDEQFEGEGVQGSRPGVRRSMVASTRRCAMLAIGEDPNRTSRRSRRRAQDHAHPTSTSVNSRPSSTAQTVKAWSDFHPRHLPIMILVETEDLVLPDPLNYGFATPIPSARRSSTRSTPKSARCFRPSSC